MGKTRDVCHPTVWVVRNVPCPVPVSSTFLFSAPGLGCLYGDQVASLCEPLCYALCLCLPMSMIIDLLSISPLH